MHTDILKFFSLQTLQFHFSLQHFAETVLGNLTKAVYVIKSYGSLSLSLTFQSVFHISPGFLTYLLGCSFTGSFPNIFFSKSCSLWGSLLGQLLSSHHICTLNDSLCLCLPKPRAKDCQVPLPGMQASRPEPKLQAGRSKKDRWRHIMKDESA